LSVRETPVTVGLAARCVRRAGAGRTWLALGVAAAVLLGGCAYFNTFHHAKRAYAKAERVQAAAKSEKLSPEAIKYYDQAIEKSAKVIVDHGGGWRAGIDDALFLMGASYYGKREYEAAIKKFRELVVNYPDSRHAVEALFFTGLCYQRLRNRALAERTFERVLREYPDFARRDEILFAMAEALETEGQSAAALRAYARMLAEYPRSRNREAAWKRVAAIHFEAQRFDSSLAAQRELARATRDDEVYFEAQLEAGACLVRLGQQEEALDIYRRILPPEPEGTEQGGRVWLAMADAENRRGNHEKALEYLALVAEHFDRRALGIEATFHAGYACETYLQDYPRAREFYEQVGAAAGTSVFKDQAARRLRNLKYMEELRAAAGEEDDLQRRAEAALKIAEFSYFEAREPAQALEKYALVVRDFPGSAVAQRAAYARGLILRELDSLGAAVQSLRGVVLEHPGSRQAARSLEVLAELEYPSDSLRVLRGRVQAAQREQAHRDSVAAALAAAAADSARAASGDTAAVIPVVPALADSAATAPRPGESRVRSRVGARPRQPRGGSLPPTVAPDSSGATPEDLPPEGVLKAAPSGAPRDSLTSPGAAAADTAAAPDSVAAGAPEESE